MRLLSGLAVLGQCVNLALSAELRIQISPSQHIPNPSTLPPSTHATLTGSSGELRALIRKDNTIVFPEIRSSGSHLLRIYTRDYVFAPYRVDITNIDIGGSDDAAAAAAAAASAAANSEKQSDGKGDTTVISGIYETYLGTQWSDHGVGLIPTNSPAVTYTLVPKTIAKKNFYEERPGFSIMVLLKNPMILLGGVALLFTFGMPKLMENMDPEMRAEFEEMQKKGPTASLGRAVAGQGGSGGNGGSGAPGGGGFDLAGYLAGSGGSSSRSSNKASSKATGREAGGNARERKK